MIIVCSHSSVAIGALTSTVTLLTQLGRFRQAADREKEIGQIFLQEVRDLGKACEALERAGEWYAQEDANAYVYLNSFHLASANSVLILVKGLPMDVLKMLRIYTLN